MLIELGNGKLGCLQNVSLSLQRAITEASCREVGPAFDGVKGQLSGSVSLDGIVIIDDPVQAGNVRAGDLVDMMLDDSNTPVNWVYGPGTNSNGVMGEPGDIAGSKVIIGQGIMTELEYAGSQDGLATYSATLTIVGKPTHAAVAA